MPFKFTESEKQTVLRTAKELQESRRVVEDAINTFNSKAAQLLLPVRAAHIAFNERVELAEKNINTILEDKGREYDEMSDVWKEGWASAPVADWLDSWEELEFERLVLPEHEELVFEYDGEELLADELPGMEFAPDEPPHVMPEHPPAPYHG